MRAITRNTALVRLANTIGPVSKALNSHHQLYWHSSWWWYCRPRTTKRLRKPLYCCAARPRQDALLLA